VKNNQEDRFKLQNNEIIRLKYFEKKNDTNIFNLHLNYLLRKIDENS
jgi:hypothetical protein